MDHGGDGLDRRHLAFGSPTSLVQSRRLDLKCQKLPKRRVTSCFRVSFMCKSMNYIII
jgi:hypothetical protein